MEEKLRWMQLAFVGKLLSGVTHELKNHFAIINESNGLMYDLLLLAEGDSPSSSERYKEIIQVVNERVGMADHTIRLLNRFAHRMDEPLSIFDVNLVIEEEVYLLQKFARQKKISLKTSFHEALPSIYNDPSLLQYVLFCIIYTSLEQLGQDGEVVISTIREEGGTGIKVVRKGEKQFSGPMVSTKFSETFPYALEKLEAKFKHSSTGADREEFFIVVPSVPIQK